MSGRIQAILGVSRAPFLLLPVALVACGAAASAYDRPADFSWWHALLALGGLVAAHIAVNAINEARDMETGIDLETERTPFSGGSGTLPAGRMSVRGAYVWGGLTLLGAAAVGVYFLVVQGPVLWPVLLFGLLSIVLYTHVFTRIGGGEVVAGLGLGALCVIGTSLALDGHAGPATWAASIPTFFMTFNLLLLNEFPDERADKKGGRRHLVIRLGRPMAAWIYALAVLAVPVSVAISVLAGWLPPLGLVAAAPSLLCVPGLRWAFIQPEAAVPIPALGGNVIWNLLTNVALAAALALSIG